MRFVRLFYCLFVLCLLVVCVSAGVEEDESVSTGHRAHRRGLGSMMEATGRSFVRGKNRVMNGVRAIGRGVANTARKAYDGGKSLVGGVWNGGSKVVSGTANGVNSATAAVWDGSTGVVRDVENGVSGRWQRMTPKQRRRFKLGRTWISPFSYSSRLVSIEC